MIINENNKKNKTYTFVIKYFNYFIFVFIFFLAFLFYQYYFEKYIEEIKNINNEKIILQEKVYDEQVYFLERLNKLKENLGSISTTDRKRIDLLLPEEDRKNLLFYYLDNLVEDNGMELKFIKFSNQEYRPPKQEKNKNNKISEEDNIKNISKLKISMKISGVNYEKLKLFLNSVENNLRLIDIEFFSFSSLDDGELNVQAISYYEPMIKAQEK